MRDIECPFFNAFSVAVKRTEHHAEIVVMMQQIVLHGD